MEQVMTSNKKANAEKKSKWKFVWWNPFVYFTQHWYVSDVV